MENISKALLIAAAVLIAILLIAMGINIVDIVKNPTEDGVEVGETIAGSVGEVTGDALNAFKDLEAKNLTKIPNHTATPVISGYYMEIFPNNPKVLLKPSTTYQISFDYKVNSADFDVEWSVGVGESTYVMDVAAGKYYKEGSSNKQGTVNAKFKTGSEFRRYSNTQKKWLVVNVPYLHLRLARMDDSGKFEVEISNVRFVEVKKN